MPGVNSSDFSPAVTNITAASLDDSGIDVDTATVAEKSPDHWSQILRCCICMDYFEDPRILPCGHTFCYGCVNTMLEHTLNSINQWQPMRSIDPNRIFIKCPQCRCRVYRYSVMSAPRDLALENAIIGWKTSAERWDLDITLANRNKMFSCCGTQVPLTVMSTVATQTSTSCHGMDISTQTCEPVSPPTVTSEKGIQCGSLVTYIVSNYLNMKQTNTTNTVLKPINMEETNETGRSESIKEGIADTVQFCSLQTQTEPSKCVINTCASLTGDMSVPSQGAAHIQGDILAKVCSPQIEAGDNATPGRERLNKIHPAHPVTHTEAADQEVTESFTDEKVDSLVFNERSPHEEHPWIRWGSDSSESPVSDLHIVVADLLGIHSSGHVHSHLTMVFCCLLASMILVVDSFFVTTSHDSPIIELLTVCMLTTVTMCSACVSLFLISSLIAIYIDNV